MTDKYLNYNKDIHSLPEDGFDITPSDGADLPQVVRKIVVGVAGTVRVTYRSGAIANYTMAAGGTISSFITKVHATGTTATNMVGEV